MLHTEHVVVFAGVALVVTVGVFGMFFHQDCVSRTCDTHTHRF